MKSLISITLFFLCVPLLSVNGQQVISAGGTHAVGANVQLSWTIGEPCTETYTGTAAILTQGFHQGKLTITAIEPISDPGISLTVFPNPVAENLNVQFEGNTSYPYRYSLFDINSREILRGKIDTNSQIIEMHSVQPGTYSLKIFKGQNEKELTFKIIKQ